MSLLSGFRRFWCRDAYVLGTPDSPIPEVLFSRALAPSGYTMVHVTCDHVTTTIPLENVRYPTWLDHDPYDLSRCDLGHITPSEFRRFQCHHTHASWIPDPRFPDVFHPSWLTLVHMTVTCNRVLISDSWHPLILYPPSLLC